MKNYLATFDDETRNYGIERGKAHHWLVEKMEETRRTSRPLTCSVQRIEDGICKTVALYSFIPSDNAGEEGCWLAII